ncbi:MAG TPA: rod shape-determining protein MreC [Phycisphaerae bacterium]|nr:rod shape-determining protein MreC [Phycisphaerae bacterium]HUT61784.1 rod shape-determining protein MreC [Phycisphaerae bacterium]
MSARVRLTKRNALVILMVLSLAAAILGKGLTARLRQVVHVFTAPLGDGGMYVVTSLRSGSGEQAARNLSLAEIQRLIEENRRLREQLVEADRRIATEAQYRRDVAGDVQRIRSSFFPSGDIACELIPARVVAADSMPYGQMRVLNQGAASGARRGAVVVSRLLMTDRSKEMPPKLAVLTASAVVGKLAAAGAFTSELQLVTDRGFHMPGRILRRIDPNRPRRISVLAHGAAAVETLSERNNKPIPVPASGDGAGGMVVTGVPAYENVLPGDWLVTTDDDPYLRTEVRVGTVEKVTPDPDDQRLVRLRVRPFEDLASLRRVYILYWKPP